MVKKKFSLEGIRTVSANINKEILKMKGKKSGEMASEHSSVISREKVVTQTIKIPMLTMGFSANYAVKVHEDMTKTYRKPNSGAKFFQSALEGSKGEILETIRQHAKIRKSK